MVFAYQDDEHLPRMAADWEEPATAHDDAEALSTLGPAFAPAIAPESAKPSPFDRFAEPIAAPTPAGWRSERRLADPGHQTRDWPSSERLQRR